MSDIERLAEKLKAEGWIVRVDGDELIAPGARLADLFGEGSILKESSDYFDDGCLSRFAVMEAEEGVFTARQNSDMEGDVMLFIYPAASMEEALQVFRDALFFSCVRTVARAARDLGLRIDAETIGRAIERVIP